MVNIAKHIGRALFVSSEFLHINFGACSSKFTAVPRERDFAVGSHIPTESASRLHSNAVATEPTQIENQFLSTDRADREVQVATLERASLYLRRCQMQAHQRIHEIIEDPLMRLIGPAKGLEMAVSKIYSRL